MDARNLHLGIDHVGTSGVVLSPEQKASLQTSLCILQSNQKFNRVYFWGKILGIKDDYFIAQGMGKDELGEKKTLYSKDCVHWGLLPPATDEAREKSKVIKGRFTGDPSHEFEHVETRKLEDGEEEEPETITLREEDRLAVMIDAIDQDVRVVPRGAYVKTPTGQVYENRSFEGLTVSEAAKFGSYMHFREPEKLHTKTLLQRANLDKSIDFLDTIDEDVPKGAWSIQFERGSGLVCLRSMFWIGYTFYHIPGSREYGSIYVGTGEKNMDLPFML